DDWLDRLVSEFERFAETVLGDLIGAAFDHQHVGFGSDVDQVEGRLVLLLVGRVDDELAVDFTDADRGDRSVPGNIRDGEGGGGAVDHQDVRLVFQIDRKAEADNLDFIEKSFGEKRAERPVAETRGENFFFGRPSFALEVAARETPGGGIFFAIVDGQGEKVLPGANVWRRGRRHEKNGVAQGN